jgi:DNA-binding response OmpR family regulator
LSAPDGCSVGLTSTEFAILAALAFSPGKTISRQSLFESVTGREWSPLDRSIDVHVGNLRRKMEADGRYRRVIKSVHGVGYLLAVDDGTPP